ncbi:MAG: T9SS type A sorting domain-containing protein [Jejuia sp.]
MQRKLLAIFFVFSSVVLSYAQTTIEQLPSPTGSEYINMTGSIDQSTSGGNVSWDFTSLSESSDISVDTYSENGGTATITTTTNGSVSSLISLVNPNAEVAVTGATAFDVQLNYTDPGVIGMFPLNFNYSNTDNVAGTFSGSGISGTIVNTSTFVVNVDAWGNLKVGAFDGEVTRLKMVQNLNLLVSGIVPTTGTQTLHFYYDANSNDLVFRTTRIIVPLASLDQTSIEMLSNYTLSSAERTFDETNVSLKSNPVKSILKLSVEGNIKVKAVDIFDITGKQVLNFQDKANDFDVSQLKSGLFILSISTDEGNVVKKFIKE